ncbi:MAG: hypothetical protein JSV73_00630 [Flavobacteriaceae bacterium]|nr:MAG: hypothetical protein JSV73_00630 [Flavobacteriaceae bacterium]
MGKNASEYKKFQIKTLALSDLFSSMEGRRPRIIVGAFSKKSGTDVSKIAHILSDMGFDVDISPLITSVERFAMNALENDVDALLMLTESNDIKAKMLGLETFLAQQKAEILLSQISNSESQSVLQDEMFKNWIVLNAETKQSELGFIILNQLLDRTN